MAHDVFISYATPDKLTADAVCARLEQHGIRCWIAPRDILPGRDWRGSIVDAIGHARALVLMLSAHANSSSEIPKEVLQATQKGVPIITFRIEDVTPAGPLSYELNTIHWMDALTKPVERHIDRLAETLQRLLGDVPLSGSTVTPVASPRTPAKNRFARTLVASAVGVVAVAALAWWLWRGAEAPRENVSPPPGQGVSPPPGQGVSPTPSTSPVAPTLSETKKSPPPGRANATPVAPTQSEPRAPSKGRAAATQAPAASASHTARGDAGQRTANASQIIREDGSQSNPGASPASREGPGQSTAGAGQTGRGDAGQVSASAGPTSREDASQSNAGVKEQPTGGSVRVVGCWTPPGGAGVMNVRPDGTFVSGGVLTGSWVTLNVATSTYVLQFPDDVGYGELSADGRRLVHSGNINTTLVRTAGGTDLTGTWQFSNGQPMTFSADGTFTLGALSGRWKLTDRAKRTYALAWPGPHPAFTIAPDGQSARYSDSRYGVNVTLQRVACSP